MAKFKDYIHLINKILASIIARKLIFVKRKNEAKKSNLTIAIVHSGRDLLIPEIL